MVALAVGALGALVVPAPSAALLRPADTDAGLIDRLHDASRDVRPTSDRPIDVRSDRVPEHLRLACVVRVTDERPIVGCHWSVPTADGAVAVRLLRGTVGSDERRQVIHTTTELRANEFVDRTVRPGHRYHYVVQSLNAQRRVIGTSRTVTVGVPPTDEAPDVEVLKLACRAADARADDTRVAVGCEWSLPSRHRARTLTLWRSVDHGAREVVASWPAPFRSSYRDVVPAGTRSVVYAVIAADGDGEIVARSRAAHVALRPPDTDARPQVAPDRPVLVPVEPDRVGPDQALPGPVEPDSAGARPDAAPPPPADERPGDGPAGDERPGDDRAGDEPGTDRGTERPG